MKKKLSKTNGLKTKRPLPSPEELNTMRKKLQNLTLHYMSVMKKQSCYEEDK